MLPGSNWDQIGERPHRIAVEWDVTGSKPEGVYIVRRERSSRMNQFAGGRLFPGVHHHAIFDVRETDCELFLAMQSDDRDTSIEISASIDRSFPGDSIFGSLDEASQFFEAGSVGYSPARDGSLDGMELRVEQWEVEGLNVQSVRSSFFENRSRFPDGSVHFDWRCSCEASGTSGIPIYPLSLRERDGVRGLSNANALISEDPLTLTLSRRERGIRPQLTAASGARRAWRGPSWLGRRGFVRHHLLKHLQLQLLADIVGGLVLALAHLVGDVGQDLGLIAHLRQLLVDIRLRDLRGEHAHRQRPLAILLLEMKRLIALADGCFVAFDVFGKFVQRDERLGDHLIHIARRKLLGLVAPNAVTAASWNLIIAAC